MLFTERGWNGKGAYEFKGWIKNSAGVETYTVKGKWDNFMEVTDKRTN